MTSRSAGLPLALAVLGVVGVLAALAAAAVAEEPERGERERMYDRYLEFASLVRGGSITPRWLDDGSRFTYAEGEGAAAATWEVDPEAGTRVRIAGDAASPGPAEDERFTPRVIRPALFPGFPPVLERLSPDRRWFALEKDHDLWLRSTADDRLERLTRDGAPDFDWKIQQDDLWSRAAWSPDGARLVAFKEDRRGVERMPIVHWLKRAEEVEWLPLARSGGQLAQTEIYLIDRFSKRRVRIVTAADDRYYSLIGWLPAADPAAGGERAEEFLLLAANRGFKRVRVLAADGVTGETRVVIEETQPSFVKNFSLDPEWTELFTLLPESRRFLWISERDGWDHLYLYDLEGRLLRRLTRGAFPVIRVIAVDEERGWAYFTARAEDRLYDTHLYRVSLEGGAIGRLTEAEGEHRIAFAPSRRYFLDTHSSLDRPPRVELRGAGGELIRVLAEADVSALDELHFRPPEAFVAKAADGETDLHGVLYKPWDFDPAKKYPVIEHIYNSPHTTYAPRAFSEGAYRGTYAQALAQLGFVTFMVDGRGTPGRGKAFHDVIYGQLGRHEIADHSGVLQQLAAERPYMDLGRVGIFGGSWGGYLAVRALLQASDVYHAGVSANGVQDLYDLDALLEGYMGTPQENPEGYDFGSNLPLAGNLKGKLLLMHGTSDVNVPFSSTMKLVDALIRAGKTFDLVVLPGQSHRYQGDAWTYRLEAHRRFFQEHLRP